MLTRQMKDVLDYIDEATTSSGGVCPSYQEIGTAVGLKSKSGVFRVVNALVERGYLRRIPYRNRAMELIRKHGTHCHHCGQLLP